MTYDECLEQVINQGVEAARKSYSGPESTHHPLMLAGAIAGFQACRSKTPHQLMHLHADARLVAKKAMDENAADYWKQRCFYAEIGWVCNCVSAILFIQTGHRSFGVGWPTVHALLAVAKILSPEKAV